MRWLAWPPLARAVPADRVWVGWAAEGARPYCTIQRERSRRLGYTSSGTTLTEHEVRFRIVADDLDTAERIAGEIAGRFHRQDLDAIGDNVLLMQRVAGTRERQPEGPWLLVETYQVKEQRQ